MAKSWLLPLPMRKFPTNTWLDRGDIAEIRFGFWKKGVRSSRPALFFNPYYKEDHIRVDTRTLWAAVLSFPGEAL